MKFTEEDFALIKEKVQHVKGATAQYGYYGATARGRKGSDFMAVLNGGNTALQYAIGSEPIVRGRYFPRVSAMRQAWSASSRRARQGRCLEQRMW